MTTTPVPSPFAFAIDTLMDSQLAERFDFEIAGAAVPNVPVLCHPPETEGDYGQVRIGEDRRRFEVRCADLMLNGILLVPERGSLLRQPAFGNLYEIQAAPWRDQLGLVWIFDAWRREDALDA